MKCLQELIKNSTLFERFHHPPLRPSFPEDCALQPPPKMPLTIISGTGRPKGKNFKFCTHSHGIDGNKSPLKCRENQLWAYPGTLRIFQSTHIIGQAIRGIARSSLRQHGFLVGQYGRPIRFVQVLARIPCSPFRARRFRRQCGQAFRSQNALNSTDGAVIVKT